MVDIDVKFILSLFCDDLSFYFSRFGVKKVRKKEERGKVESKRMNESVYMEVIEISQIIWNIGFLPHPSYFVLTQSKNYYWS